MNTLHDNPKGRPVHPECAAATSGVCRCTVLWDEWLGSSVDLHRRINAARRDELRAKPSNATHVLDLDGVVLEEETDEESPTQGAWELSKFLDQLPGPCVRRDPNDPELKESLDRLRKHIVSRGYWDDE